MSKINWWKVYATIIMIVVAPIAMIDVYYLEWKRLMREL